MRSHRTNVAIVSFSERVELLLNLTTGFLMTLAAALVLIEASVRFGILG